MFTCLLKRIIRKRENSSMIHLVFNAYNLVCFQELGFTLACDTQARIVLFFFLSFVTLIFFAAVLCLIRLVSFSLPFFFVYHSKIVFCIKISVFEHSILVTSDFSSLWERSWRIKTPKRIFPEINHVSFSWVGTHRSFVSPCRIPFRFILYGSLLLPISHA